MRLSTGTRLGSYEILAPLGAGGMGEVYRARDAKLDRDVALKILSDRLAGDAQAMARFEREAKAVAALSHPGILAIHDFGRATADGSEIAYTVTEFLNGETLRSSVALGPIPVRRAVEYGVQVAQALAAAHAKGIVHRDLKPENVFLTSEGRVKILDFGLARVFMPDGGRGADEFPTATLGTDPGLVVGTAAYMSPEQAAGRPADSRSDIFSLGVVVHEMLSGRRPFDRDTVTETLAAILRDDPPALDPARVPSALQRIVTRCLEKRPDERFQSARDLAFALGSWSEASQALAPLTAARRRWRPTALIGTLGAIAVAAAAFGLGRWSSQPAVQARAVGTTRQLTSGPGEERWPSLTPDGQTIAFAGNARGNLDIYALRVGGSNAVNLTPDSPEEDDEPAISPDGQSIAFRSGRNGGGIFLMGLTGESPRRLTDFGYYPAWSPDGKAIVVCTRDFWEASNRPDYESELWAIDVASGEKRLVAKADSIQPSWSPHGERIAFWSKRANDAQRDLFTVSARGGAPVALNDDTAVDWNPVWSRDGRFLFYLSDRSGTQNLWRLPIDEHTGRATGEPQPIVLPSAVVADLALSSEGRRIVYATREIRGAFERLEIDANGRGRLLDPLMRTTGLLFNASFSPDAESLVVSMESPQSDLYVVRWDGTGTRRITDDRWLDRMPDWSPDGRWIAFQSTRQGTGVFRIRPDGSGLVAVTHEPTTTMYPIWAPGSRRLIASREQGTRPTVFPVEGGGEPVDLAALPQKERFIADSWSPDGGRIVGTFLEGNGAQTGIYAFASHSWAEVSNALAAEWMPDSRHLLVLRREGIFRVDPDTGAEAPVLGRPTRSRERGQLAVSRDGRRAVFWEGGAESDLWTTELPSP